MKINEIIRKKRLAKGLTQEQAASRLGVSPPAVNKWEKGVTYPDITLLPALARLLDTDLNTLLSFQEELSDQEIEAFQNELLAAAETEGTQKAFALAMEKLREFPSCDTLVLSTALTLEGLICFYGKPDGDEAEDVLERLYVQAAGSADAPTANQAKVMLFQNIWEDRSMKGRKNCWRSCRRKRPTAKTDCKSAFIQRRKDGKKRLL